MVLICIAKAPSALPSHDIPAKKDKQWQNKSIVFESVFLISI